MAIYELAAVGAAPAGRLRHSCLPAPRRISEPSPSTGHDNSSSLSRSGSTLASGTWRDLQPDVLLPLLLSGIAGMFIADTLLVTCLNRLGRAAPESCLRSMGLLQRCLAGHARRRSLRDRCDRHRSYACGVILAILFGKRQAQQHRC